MDLKAQQQLEQQALGNLLLKEDSQDYLSLLKREYITFEHHIPIYDAIVKASEKGYESGFHAVSAMLSIDGSPEIKETLKNVLQDASEVVSLKDLCKLLHEAYLKRVGINLLTDSLESREYSDVSLYEVSDKITDELIKQPVWEEQDSFGDIILQAFNSATNPEDHKGFKPHLKEWYDKIGEFCPGELTTIAGFPGVGKSVLALNLSWNMCKGGARVRYVSLEETQDKLLYRLLAEEASVPITAFKYGLKGKQPENVLAAGENIKHHNFTVDTQSKSLNDIMASCVEQNREDGLDIVVIDPVSYIEGLPPTELEKANAVGLFGLKLALRLDCHVILVAHVNS